MAGWTAIITLYVNSHIIAHLGESSLDSVMPAIRLLQTALVSSLIQLDRILICSRMRSSYLMSCIEYSGLQRMPLLRVQLWSIKLKTILAFVTCNVGLEIAVQFR